MSAKPTRYKLTSGGLSPPADSYNWIGKPVTCRRVLNWCRAKTGQENVYVPSPVHWRTHRVTHPFDYVFIVVFGSILNKNRSYHPPNRPLFIMYRFQRYIYNSVIFLGFTPLFAMYILSIFLISCLYVYLDICTGADLDDRTFGRRQLFPFGGGTNDIPGLRGARPQ